MSAATEATKTGGRVAVLGAISTVVLYLIGLVLPDMPEQVSTALLVLLTAGLAWLDNYAHEKGSQMKVPF